MRKFFWCCWFVFSGLLSSSSPFFFGVRVDLVFWLHTTWKKLIFQRRSSIQIKTGSPSSFICKQYIQVTEISLLLVIVSMFSFCYILLEMWWTSDCAFIYFRRVEKFYGTNGMWTLGGQCDWQNWRAPELGFFSWTDTKQNRWGEYTSVVKIMILNYS